MDSSSEPPHLTRRVLLAAAAAGLASPAMAQNARRQPQTPPPPPLAPAPLVVLTPMRAEARLRGPNERGTPVWGYWGQVPGPTLRLKRDQEQTITVHNALDEPTALHIRGFRGENRMDGIPGLTQAAIAPGDRFNLVVKPRDAGTFLYRPWHPEFGAAQVARGLSGAFIVDEATPVEVDQDQLFVLDEWVLDPTGAIAETAIGVLRGTGGEAVSRVITVNGGPNFEILARQNERLRLRFVNASHSSLLRLAIRGVPLTLVAIDGQPSEPFMLEGSSVVMGPGQRVDIMVDATDPPGTRYEAVIDNLIGERLVGQFLVSSEAPRRNQSLTAPKQLPPNPISQQLPLARAFRTELSLVTRADGETRFAGKSDRAPRPEPDFRVRRGTVVAIGLPNDTKAIQAVQLHGHAARLLDGVDDGWKPFFLDTIMLAPGTTSRIAFLADNPGKWVIAAQAIGEARGPLVSWFEVT